jgi:hypothetical protein
MKRGIFILLIVFISISAQGQQILTEKKVNLSFSGFVKNDFIVDTRRNLEAVDGLYTLWPLKPSFDANGEDINAQPSARMFCISTRFATRLSGLMWSWTSPAVMQPTAFVSVMPTPHLPGQRPPFYLDVPGILPLLKRYFPE